MWGIVVERWAGPGLRRWPWDVCFVFVCARVPELKRQAGSKTGCLLSTAFVDGSELRPLFLGEAAHFGTPTTLLLVDQFKLLAEVHPKPTTPPALSLAAFVTLGLYCSNQDRSINPAEDTRSGSRLCGRQHTPHSSRQESESRAPHRSQISTIRETTQ